MNTPPWIQGTTSRHEGDVKEQDDILSAGSVT